MNTTEQLECWRETAVILDKALSEALDVIEHNFNSEIGARNVLADDHQLAAGRLLYRHRGDRWTMGGNILTRRNLP